ncbi:MAG: hypothetical protein ACOCWR_01090 [Oceanidesulfovibrio sp.]
MEYEKRFDFHTICGESAGVRRFMEEYAPEHMEPAGSYEFVITADVTQHELEDCVAEWGRGAAAISKR